MAASDAPAISGVVLDRRDGRPVRDALVVSDGSVERTDALGRFESRGPGPLAVRAVGYRPVRTTGPGPDGSARILMDAVRPRALYLSAYGIGSAALREAALGLVARGAIDALVIDVKGDRGVVPYRSAAVVGAGLGPQATVLVADMPALMSRLRALGLYLIARIVVFKDDPYALAKPEWAVRDPRGGVWRDREGLGWIDPTRHEAWERTLALAEEAAALGFDEIQFDYLRFPDAPGLLFSGPATESVRVATISAFLDAARRRLLRRDVSIAADIFGYVAWNADDTGIGQRLEPLAERVDYLCPMLYPSGFTFGIPGHRDPVVAPHEIVEQTLRRAMVRTGLPAIRFRPWLQAFPDYAFDRRPFGPAEVRAQIEAADAVGTNGWMLWNPHNRYDAAGLAP